MSRLLGDNENHEENTSRAADTWVMNVVPLRTMRVTDIYIIPLRADIFSQCLQDFSKMWARLQCVSEIHSCNALKKGTKIMR